jgi:hypothetical protein
MGDVVGVQRYGSSPQTGRRSGLLFGGCGPHSTDEPLWNTKPTMSRIWVRVESPSLEIAWTRKKLCCANKFSALSCRNGRLGNTRRRQVLLRNILLSILRTYLCVEFCTAHYIILASPGIMISHVVCTYIHRHRMDFPMCGGVFSSHLLVAFPRICCGVVTCNTHPQPLQEKSYVSVLLYEFRRRAELGADFKGCLLSWVVLEANGLRCRSLGGTGDE